MTVGLAGSANGFDAFGHFIRSALVVNSSCFAYYQPRLSGCASDFGYHSADNAPPAAATKSASSSSATSSSAAPSADSAALDYLLGSGN
jgi:hypothetical protein